MGNNRVLTVNNLNKSYIKGNNKIEVLKNLSCDFSTGNLYAITGKSGAGKSTLLKCLAALTKVDSGEIKYYSNNITRYNDEEISKFRNEKLGIVFQDYNLIEFLNVYDNILLPTVISGATTFNDRNNARVNELIEFVDLIERKEHLPNELSGGEKQRVAIARALINDPDIILADEPTGSVDNENKKNVLELLKKISKEKCVILVTHDDNTLKYADVIFKLEKGSLVKDEKK